MSIEHETEKDETMTPAERKLIADGWKAVMEEPDRERERAQREQLDALLGLLDSPEAEQYFRGSFVVKLIGLACAIRHSNITRAAKAYGVSQQAVSRQACRARKIFRLTT